MKKNIGSHEFSAKEECGFFKIKISNTHPSLGKIDLNWELNKTECKELIKELEKYINEYDVFIL